MTVKPAGKLNSADRSSTSGFHRKGGYGLTDRFRARGWSLQRPAAADASCSQDHLLTYLLTYLLTSPWQYESKHSTLAESRKSNAARGSLAKQIKHTHTHTHTHTYTGKPGKKIFSPSTFAVLHSYAGWFSMRRSSNDLDIIITETERVSLSVSPTPSSLLLLLPLTFPSFLLPSFPPFFSTVVTRGLFLVLRAPCHHAS